MSHYASYSEEEGEDMDKFEVIEKIFPVKMRKLLHGENGNRERIDFDEVNEIRIRVNRPVLFYLAGDGVHAASAKRNGYMGGVRELFLAKGGGLTGRPAEAYEVGINEIKELLEYACNYSVYAYEEHIRQGYLTIEGGHRIGVCGRASWQNQEVTAMKYISAVNIRIAHEVRGCSDGIYRSLWENGHICNTLLISPPGVGKTTMLRDLVRNISDGAFGQQGKSVAVVDERSEIAACHMGIPQNHVGMRTDILDGCSKTVGMYMLVRSMAPQVVAVDEIGGEEDIRAISYLSKCGCAIIASVHGESFETLRERKYYRGLVSGGVFERYVVLEMQREGERRASVYDTFGHAIQPGSDMVAADV